MVMSSAAAAVAGEVSEMRAEAAREAYDNAPAGRAARLRDTSRFWTSRPVRRAIILLVGLTGLCGYSLWQQFSDQPGPGPDQVSSHVTEAATDARTAGIPRTVAPGLRHG